MDTTQIIMAKDNISLVEFFFESVEFVGDFAKGTLAAGFTASDAQSFFNETFEHQVLQEAKEVVRTLMVDGTLAEGIIVEGLPSISTHVRSMDESCQCCRGVATRVVNTDTTVGVSIPTWGLTVPVKLKAGSNF